MSQEYCVEIKSNKHQCIEPDCTSWARGKTNKCVKHGGGKRCNEPDCSSSAMGKSEKCVKHGGGKRCNEPDCSSSAIGKNDKCGKKLYLFLKSIVNFALYINLLIKEYKTKSYGIFLVSFCFGISSISKGLEFSK